MKIKDGSWGIFNLRPLLISIYRRMIPGLAEYNYISLFFMMKDNGQPDEGT